MIHSYGYCFCCYRKVEVYRTLEIICVPVFLQMNTILNKGLIFTFLIQRNLSFQILSSKLEAGKSVLFK